MKNKKAFYYTVTVPHAVNRGWQYFKAFKKKDIREHLRNSNISDAYIYDPYEKPEEGITYKDLTK